MTAPNTQDKPTVQGREAPAERLLFKPITLRGVTARNRIVVSPMSQYAAVDTMPTEWHLVHLGKFAMGGAGIVFVEETAVEQRARKTYHCPGIYNDAQAKAWRRITDFLRSQGALSGDPTGPCRPQGRDQGAVGRLCAADRRTTPSTASAPWQGIAPSPIPFKPGAMVPLRDGSRRHQDRDREPRRSLPPLGRRRLRHLRNPRRARLRHPAVPVADHQQAHRRLRRRHRRPHALRAWS